LPCLLKRAATLARPAEFQTRSPMRLRFPI
jgi:hypothetical protein